MSNRPFRRAASPRAAFSARAGTLRLVLVSVAAVVLPMRPHSHAEPAATPPPTAAAGSPALHPAYESFRLVRTRNVFDPDRRPVRPATTAPAAPVTRADYAALTGTLLSAEKSYAFFSGSRPEFNRVLTVRDKIANATITGITPQNIEIERDGKRTTIAVGLTVPFDNQSAPGTPPVEAPAAAASTDGASSPAAAAAPPAAAPRPAGGGSASAAPSAASPKGPPNIDEIRRRMMEKRQQELK